MFDNNRSNRSIFARATGKVDFVTWMAAATVIAISTISCVAFQLGFFHG